MHNWVRKPLLLPIAMPQVLAWVKLGNDEKKSHAKKT
jgi:hypothetical protein